jgi:hypothetical protein
MALAGIEKSSHCCICQDQRVCHSRSCLLIEYGILDPKFQSSRPRFILGILSNHHKSHAKTRQTLRDTYLSFYQNNTQSSSDQSTRFVLSMNIVVPARCLLLLNG